MKITIDTNNKSINIEKDVNLAEFFSLIKKLFEDEYKEWKIKGQQQNISVSWEKVFAPHNSIHNQ